MRMGSCPMPRGREDILYFVPGNRLGSRPDPSAPDKNPLTARGWRGQSMNQQGLQPLNGTASQSGAILFSAHATHVVVHALQKVIVDRSVAHHQHKAYAPGQHALWTLPSTKLFEATAAGKSRSGQRQCFPARARCRRALRIASPTTVVTGTPASVMALRCVQGCVGFRRGGHSELLRLAVGKSAPRR